MIRTKKVIGIDIGASGGKMALGEFDGEHLTVREYRNFPNTPQQIGSALYWDLFALYREVLQGIQYFGAEYGPIDFIGIDTWGASYGLLDRYGRLLEPIYHYRDLRTADIMQQMNEVCDPWHLFELTGCQCNRTYTLPQLYCYHVTDIPSLKYADKLLFLPDLLSYFLTGNTDTEQTIAGTSGLMNNQLEGWSKEVAELFDIPERLYTPIIPPATDRGLLIPSIRGFKGLEHTHVIATAGHDSAAAEAAIPYFDESQLYISIGTNISMGAERNASLLTKEAFLHGMKNTGGVGGKKIVYRDFSACWHINEFVRTRREVGVNYTFEELAKMAKDVKREVPWIDVEDAILNEAGGDYCKKMDRFFEQTNQRKPENDAERIRSIYESIVLKICHYTRTFYESGFAVKKINVISGAVRNEYLMQIISTFLATDIYASMPYASLFGNMLVQLTADHNIRGLSQLREISGRSFNVKVYEPMIQKCFEAIEHYESIMT